MQMPTHKGSNFCPPVDPEHNLPSVDLTFYAQFEPFYSLNSCQFKFRNASNHCDEAHSCTLFFTKFVEITFFSAHNGQVI